MIGEMFLLGYMTMQSLRYPYLSTCERPYHRNPKKIYSPIQLVMRNDQDPRKFFESLRIKSLRTYKKNKHNRNFPF